MNYKSNKIKKLLMYYLLNTLMHLPGEIIYYFLYCLGVATINGKEVKIEWVEKTENFTALQNDNCLLQFYK